MTTEKKPWFKSKVKWSSILIGAGAVLTTAGGILNGSIEFITGIQALAVEVGIILAVFGIRDLPFINRTK